MRTHISSRPGDARINLKSEDIIQLIGQLFAVDATGVSLCDGLASTLEFSVLTYTMRLWYNEAVAILPSSVHYPESSQPTIAPSRPSRS